MQKLPKFIKLSKISRIVNVSSFKYFLSGARELLLLLLEKNTITEVGFNYNLEIIELKIDKFVEM